MAIDALGLIVGALGSALQAKGAKKAAAANTAGQQAAADYAMEGSMPWNVGGTLGGVKFDSEGKNIGLALSPELQAQYDAYLASADANRGYLSGIEGSPQDAAQRFYEQEMALIKPEQAVARGELDAQLLARGMLGGTGGAVQASALAQAQGNVRLQSRQSASDRVQDMIDNYRSRISGDVTGAVDLGQLPLQYAELGMARRSKCIKDQDCMSEVKALSPAAIEGAKFLSGGSTAAAKGMMGRYKGYGDAARSFLNYAGGQDSLTRQQHNEIKYGADRNTGGNYSGYKGGRGGRGNYGYKKRL